MTILVTQLGRKAKFSLEKFQRDYDDNYEILTSSASIGRIAVLGALASHIGVTVVPWVGASYLDPLTGESDSRARLKDIQVQQTDRKNGLTWSGTVSYSTQTVDEQKQKDSPADEPPKWSGGGRVEEKNLTKDVNGNPIVNSAMLPFAQGALIGSNVQTLTLVRKRTLDDFPNIGAVSDHVEEVQNKCNFDDWQGFPALNLCCDSVSYEEGFDSSIPFWKFTYQFSQGSADQPDRSQLVYLDAGFEEIVSAGPPPTYRRIRDSATGQPVTLPFPLDGGGHKGDASTPTYVSFTVRKSVPFGVIL